MRRTLRSRSTGFAAVVLTLTALTAYVPAPSHGAQVSVERITLALPSNDLHPLAVNADGDVAGQRDMVPPTTAFAWDEVGAVDMRAAASAAGYDLGFTNIMFRSLSPSGAITGLVMSASTQTMFRWSRLHGFELASTPGTWSSWGAGFLAVGVVGNAEVAGVSHAVLWPESGAPQLLPDLGSASRVVAANGDDVAVGTADSPDGLRHLVRWQGTGLEDLGVIGRVVSGLSEFTENSLVVDRDGAVSGALTSTDGTAEAIQWRPGSTLRRFPVPPDLALFRLSAAGTWAAMRCTSRIDAYCVRNEIVSWRPGSDPVFVIDGGSRSYPTGVNDAGQIVGTVVETDGSSTLFFWDPACGLSHAPRVGMILDSGPLTPDGTTMVARYSAPPDTANIARMHIALEPCPPAGLTAQAGPFAASLTWPAADGRNDPVRSYRVYRDGVPVADLGPSTKSFTDTSVAPGPHEYAVTAGNNNGESRPTGVTVDVPAAEPAAPQADDSIAPVLVDLGTTAATPVAALPAFTG